MSDAPVKTPPQDLDAEGAVISAILLYPEALDKVFGIVDAADFYSTANGYIFKAASELVMTGQPVDIVTVSGWLRDHDKMAVVTPSYLAEIVDAVPAVAHIEAYAKRVSEKAQLRRLIFACSKIVAGAYEKIPDHSVFMDAAEQSIFDVARSARKRRMAVDLSGPIGAFFTRITEAAERGERITGVATGFDRLDAKTAGMHDGELTIVAARPGMGKTAFALKVAKNIAEPKTFIGDDGVEYEKLPRIGVVFLSLEMPNEQLAGRVVCEEAKVDLGKARQGYLSERDWNELHPAATKLYGYPIFLEDTPAITVLDARSIVRTKQAEYDRKDDQGRVEQRIGLVVIDYLQLMTGFGDSREQEVSSVSRALKALSKELRIPVLALSQLNRAVEQRGKDKRPQLSDLRESGAIEQDADNIIFIYRDDYYDEDSQEKGIAELIVAKQRNGPTGTVKVRWFADRTGFENLAPGEYEEEHA